MLKKLLPEVIKRPLRAYLHSQRQHWSQAGQDLWVFGEVFDGKNDGFFVDAGAHDGITLSNTYLLEKRYGWRGICIEANPESFQLLRRNRAAICVNVCLDKEDGVVEFEKAEMFGRIVSEAVSSSVHQGARVSLAARSLQDVLQAHQAPSEIDYLSIDIEGSEERVLSGFPFDRWMFRCVTIERPSYELRLLLGVNKYVLIKDIPGLDCFYVHQSFVDEYLKNLFLFYERKCLKIGLE